MKKKIYKNIIKNIC